jgi:hypothetical protein
MPTIISKGVWYSQFEEIKTVYNGTLPSGRMRGLIVNLYVTYSNDYDINEEDRGDLQESFLFELFVGMLYLRSLPKDPTWFLDDTNDDGKVIKKDNLRSLIVRLSSN